MRDRFEVIMNAIKTGVAITDPRNRFEEVINALVGAGGGSDVSVTPLLTEGTKIAEIEVDGADYDLYAPAAGGPHFEVISKSTGLAYGNPVEVEANSFTNDSILCFEILGPTMSYNMFCLGRLVLSGPFTIGCDSQGGDLWYQITFDGNDNTFTITNNVSNAPAITNILAWK